MRAIRDYQGPLKEHEVTIFVRRGGPNYQEGLRVMGEVGKMGNFSSPPFKDGFTLCIWSVLPACLPVYCVQRLVCTDNKRAEGA